MDWISFASGAISVSFVYALFKGDQVEDDDDELIAEENEDDEFMARHVTLSCQTCRKLKKHREIEHNLYQCTKCKRHVDLR